jgi:hypothetical protein
MLATSESSLRTILEVGWSGIEQLPQGQRGWVLFDVDPIISLHYKNIQAALH